MGESGGYDSGTIGGPRDTLRAQSEALGVLSGDTVRTSSGTQSPGHCAGTIEALCWKDWDTGTLWGDTLRGRHSPRDTAHEIHPLLP